MSRKRYSDEDILKLLREIELKLASGSDVPTACRSVGISDGTYYTWRKRFGGMGRSQLSELKTLEKENNRLKKIVAELELDKLILKEGLDFFLDFAFGFPDQRPFGRRFLPGLKFLNGFQLGDGFPPHQRGNRVSPHRNRGAREQGQQGGINDRSLHAGTLWPSTTRNKHRER